jgi:hypothetical protein
MQRHLLRESEASDKVASCLGRIGQTDRQRSYFTLMKAVVKATDNFREKATKQQAMSLLLSIEDSKPTGRATDKVVSSL